MLNYNFKFELSVNLLNVIMKNLCFGNFIIIFKWFLIGDYLYNILKILGLLYFMWWGIYKSNFCW